MFGIGLILQPFIDYDKPCNLLAVKINASSTSSLSLSLTVEASGSEQHVDTRVTFRLTISGIADIIIVKNVTVTKHHYVYPVDLERKTSN